MLYRELRPRLQERPPFENVSKPPLLMLGDLIRLHLNITTWLALGATLQATLVLLPIPLRYTLAPATLFLLYRFVLTICISSGWLSNYQLGNTIIPGRFTAIIPDQYGNFPVEDDIPTSQKVVVFILHARVNHPGGWFTAPHADGLRDHFKRMNDELHEQPQSETGFLGHSQSYMPGENGSVGLLNVSYWRSKEHILRYADSPTHRASVKWWTEMGAYDGKGGKVPHICIGHEIYESDPGQWENVFIGAEPTMIGATSFFKPGNDAEKGVSDGQWISPVIDASRGRLAGSRGRMGLPISQKQHEGVQM